MATTDTLPNQLCTSCANSATCVVPFIRLAKDSARRWNQITDYLFTLEEHKRETKKRKNIYVEIGEDLQTRVSSRYKEAPAHQRLKNLKKSLNKTKTGGKKCSNVLVKCPECNKAFTKICKLNIHMRVVNKKMCSYCKEICHIKEFGDHVKTHGVEVSSCKICYGTFENDDKFLKHKKWCKRLSYACIDCNYSFSSSEQLVHHLPVHHAKTCPGCCQTFSNKACIKYHFRHCKFTKMRSDCQKYICDYCSKEYNCKPVLKLHIFHRHMSLLNYICEVCGKKFSIRQHLEEHENTHVKIDDRFTCEVCDAKFSSRRGYQKHLTSKGHFLPYMSDGKLQVRVPAGQPGRYESRLQCEVCFQTFAYQKRLREHLRMKHRIEEWKG